MTANPRALAGILAIFASCTAGKSSPESAYVGQPLPGVTPELFAPGLVSTSAIELNGVFSPDQREFYFTRVIDGVDTMHQIVLIDGQWGRPRALLLIPDHPRAEVADMVLSHDGQEFFFLAKLPQTSASHESSFDIWRSRRIDGGWSEAELVPAPISTAANELYPSFGPDGSLYINSDRSGIGMIYRAARLPDGSVAPPVVAGHPFLPRDGDTAIAPDGSYIVTSAQRPRVGGTYKNDLFVSFRRIDGTWEDFVKLDDTFNTPAHEWCPMVTPDGKFLFFSRRFGAYDKEGWDGTTDGEVYWVDVRALDKYRPANR